MNQFQNRESEYNKTSTSLTSSSTYTGSWEDVSEFSEIRVYAKTDQESTLKIQFSPDGRNIDSSLSYVIRAETPIVHRLATTRPYFRITIENTSSSDQTYLRAGALFFNDNGILTAPLNTNQSQYADAINTRPTYFQDEAVIGRRNGARAFFKFGYREGLTAAGGEQTVWATTGNYTQLTTGSTFTIAYNGTNDGANGTGAKSLFFQYIDDDGISQEANHVLESDGSDVTSFSGLGINRVAVSSTGSAIYNNNDITITATTGGTTQAIIPAQGSVTQQCIYHVAHNARAVVREITFNALKTSGGQSSKILIKGYAYNRLIATRFEIFRSSIDTSVQNVASFKKPIGLSLSPSDTLVFIADTDQDNTDVRMRFSLIEYENVVS